MRDLEFERNRRILVIDDNPAIHEDFRKILDSRAADKALIEAETAFFGEACETSPQLEVELESAHQGKEGFEKVLAAVKAGTPYAMAFVDMRMPPGWDGLVTIEKLWEADPDLQVVICTAYSDNTWSEICERLGDTDQLLILKKPFDNVEVCQLALALTEKWFLTKQARLKREDLERLVEVRTTQLREAEASLRQKQKLEAIGSLAQGVAHEFNNLLQIMREYMRFALDELPPNSQGVEDLSTAIEAVDQAGSITDQLLRFSRNQPPETAQHLLDDIVQKSVAMVRPLIPSSIDLQVDLRVSDGIANVDQSLISQVIVNLCINARDAIPEVGSLMISTMRKQLGDRRGRMITPEEPDLAPGDYTLISVTDSGCGISEEALPKVFDPFFTTKDVGKGTGLGLAVAYGVVRDHKGTITVESAEGEGSTFRVFLPVESVAPKSIGQGSEENNTHNISIGASIIPEQGQSMVCEKQLGSSI